MNFVYFLGRFHVLVLHLPIALALTVILVEWLSRRERFRYLAVATPFLWSVTAITAIATVALGYMHFSEGGFTGPSATAHRFFGTSIAVVATLAWALQSASRATFQRAQPVISVVLLVLVILTGHFGGNLTHGDTYLVEYAPEPLRRLAGLEAARAPVTDLAMADPYLDIVHPIFSQRCFSCHNDDKQRGGLNLANYAAVMKGGDDGPVVVAGDADKSDLIRRISLPHDDKDAMPAEGKPPLTEDQITVLRWWVTSGAVTGTTLGTDIPADIKPLLAAAAGIGAGGATVASSGGDAPEQKADTELVSKLTAAGFMVRQEDLSDPRLIVSAPAPGGHYSEAQLSGLDVAAQTIVELNLSRSNLEDAALPAIGKLPSLVRLRLDNNKLSDKGLKALAGLTELTYLNLHGNTEISDAAIEELAKLPKLQSVYLWNTGVSPQGAARLKQLRPDLAIDLGEELVPAAVPEPPKAGG
jgi:uncharacterized membrane protein/mono/diheme cytochrome c family protein